MFIAPSFHGGSARTPSFLSTITKPLCLVLALSIQPLCFAETGMELDQTITVTGSRSANVSESLPVGTVIIERDDIRNSGADNLVALLDQVGGINGRRLFGIGTAGSSIDLGGFGVTAAQNTLVLLNGRKLNDVDLAAVDFSAVPLAAIERIEILPGSGSVLYGNGASGGTINIITRQQYDTHIGVHQGIGRYNTREGAAWATFSHNRFHASASAQGLESDGYRDNNELEQRSAFADLRYQAERFAIWLTGTADRQDLRLPGARTTNIPAGTYEFENDIRGTGTPKNWADQEGYQLMPGFRFNFSPELRFTLDTSHRKKEQVAYYDQGFGFTSHVDSTLDSQGFHPRLEWIGEGKVQQELILGWDYYDTDYVSDRSLNEQSSPQPIHQIDINQKQRAWYLQDSIHLMSNSIITLGGRHEWVTQEALDIFNPNAPNTSCYQFGFCPDQAGLPFRKTEEEETLQLGIRQFIGSNFSVFLNGEKSTRFATVDEIFEADPNQGFVSSLDPLKPQTAETGTLGFSWKSEKLDATLSTYRSHLRNEIYYSPTLSENINLEPTKRYGVTLNSKWQLTKHLATIINGAFQRARIRDGQFEGNEIPVVPRQTGYLALEWTPLSGNSEWKLLLSQRYVGKKYFDNDQANSFGNRIPSYRWTNLVSRWQQDQLWLSLSVENLTNEKVFDYGVCSGSFTPNFMSTCNKGIYNGYPLPEKSAMFRIGLEY